MQHPVTGPGQVPGVVFRIDGEGAGDGAQVRGAAPVMGQHNEEVLRDAGFTADEIEAMRAAGTIGGRA